MKNILVLFYSSFLITLLPIVSTGQKIPVKVIFIVAEEDYVENFTRENLRVVESVGADSIASLFNQFIPLFTFSNSSIVEDSLMIKLERRPNGSPFLFYIDWKARIRGKNVPIMQNDHTWEFLSSAHYTSVLRDDPVAFVNEIYGVLKTKLVANINQTDLVEGIFSKIKITNKVDDMDLDQKRWTLPYTYNTLNVGRNSEFRVDHLFLQEEHKDFDCKVVGEPGPGRKILIKSDQSLQDYTIQQFTALDGVYILRYNPLKISNDGF